MILGPVLAAAFEPWRSHRWPALVLVALSASGCSSPFGLDEKRLLAGAREQWDDRPFRDYVFETGRACFCREEDIGPVRITVRQNEIVTVTQIETGEAAAPESWYTIEQLFDLIPQFAGQNGVKDVAVEYDPTLGYPSSVRVRFDDNVLDAGSSYAVSAVGAAP
jgi:hypothetical protein